MRDYSQSGEQQMILDWVERRGLETGRWLDIGAADGVTASNTRALAELGWSGVAVEAAASQFDSLVDAYHDRRDIALVQAAVVVDPRLPALIPFHYSRDLVSTTEQANANVWADLVDFCATHVAAVSVSELLKMFPGPYDLVSIDTEGTSIEIWNQLRTVRGGIAASALLIVEAENGGERWEIQQACLDGWARVGTTPNNVLLEKL